MTTPHHHSHTCSLLATVAVATIVAGSLGVVGGKAHADVIAGPPLTLPDNIYTFSGVGFVANDISTLTSFVFQNQGFADTVDLYSSSGTILDSLAIPSGQLSYTAAVSWALTSGQQYYLLQTTATNSLYAQYGGTLPSDTDITLTDSGIFSFSPPPSSNFALSGNQFWAAFNDITTSTAAVPAPPIGAPTPANIALLAAALGLFHFMRRSWR